MSQTIPDLPPLENGDLTNCSVTIATVKQTQSTTNDAPMTFYSEVGKQAATAQQYNTKSDFRDDFNRENEKKIEKIEENRYKAILFLVCLLASLFLIPLIITNNYSTTLVPVASNIGFVSPNDLNDLASPPRIGQLDHIYGKYIFKLPHIVIPVNANVKLLNGTVVKRAVLVSVSLYEIQKQMTINKQLTSSASNYISIYQNSQSVLLKSSGKQESLADENPEEMYYVNFMHTVTSATGTVRAFDVDKVNGVNNIAGITDALEVFMVTSDRTTREVWCMHDSSEFAKAVTDITTSHKITRIETYSIKLIGSTAGFDNTLSENQKNVEDKRKSHGTILITLSGSSSDDEKIAIAAAIDIDMAKMVWCTEIDMTSSIEKDDQTFDVLDELQLKQKKRRDAFNTNSLIRPIGNMTVVRRRSSLFDINSTDPEVAKKERELLENFNQNYMRMLFEHNVILSSALSSPLFNYSPSVITHKINGAPSPEVIMAIVPENKNTPSASNENIKKFTEMLNKRYTSKTVLTELIENLSLTEEDIKSMSDEDIWTLFSNGVGANTVCIRFANSFVILDVGTGKELAAYSFRNGLTPYSLELADAITIDLPERIANATKEQKEIYIEARKKGPILLTYVSENEESSVDNTSPYQLVAIKLSRRDSTGTVLWKLPMSERLISSNRNKKSNSFGDDLRDNQRNQPLESTDDDIRVIKKKLNHNSELPLPIENPMVKPLVYTPTKPLNKRVIALSPTGILFCADAASGTLLWRTSVTTYNVPSRNAMSSLTVHRIRKGQDVVILVLGSDISVYDAVTGAEIASWAVESDSDLEMVKDSIRSLTVARLSLMSSEKSIFVSSVKGAKYMILTVTGGMKTMITLIERMAVAMLFAIILFAIATKVVDVKRKDKN